MRKIKDFFIVLVIVGMYILPLFYLAFLVSDMASCQFQVKLQKKKKQFIEYLPTY